MGTAHSCQKMGCSTALCSLLLSHRVEQGLDSAGSTRDAQEEPEQPNPGALISHLHLYKGFISQSDFICGAESQRKLTGVWIVLEEINSNFHCCDLKLFKQRQKKRQCLGAAGIYSTKMRVNHSNWSRASSVTSGGFWWCCAPVSLPEGGLRGGRVLGTAWELGKHHCPATEAPGPKEGVNEA